MKRLFIVTAVIFMLATAVEAKNLPGKFGFGYENTLAGAKGVNLIYYFNPHAALEAILGMNYVSVSSGSDLIFHFAFGAKYNFARAKDTNLGIGLRANIGYASLGSSGTTTSVTNFALEIPLYIEYFFTNHFAMHSSFGIVFDVIPKEGPLLDRDAKYSDTTFIHIFDRAGMMGNVGLTFYF